MASIRNETYQLIEKIPDDYIYWLNELIKKFIADKEIDNEDEKLARWQADPDKYENEIYSDGNDLRCLLCKGRKSGLIYRWGGKLLGQSTD